MPRRRLVYEGKSRILYEGPEPGTLVQYYTDEAASGENKQRRVVDGKGVLNNRICEHVMTNLNRIDILTHFIRRLNMREQLVLEVEPIQLRLVVHNIAVDDFARRYGSTDGEPLRPSVMEFYMMSEELGNPLVNDDHIHAFKLTYPDALAEMRELATRTNDFLSGMFLSAGMRLADFQLEFGWVYDDEGHDRLVVTDDISPDTCRLLDIATGTRLDSDNMRKDVDGLIEAYSEVALRLGVVRPSEGLLGRGPRLVGKPGETLKVAVSPPAP